jgi:hypothetical protein
VWMRVLTGLLPAAHSVLSSPGMQHDMYIPFPHDVGHIDAHHTAMGNRLIILVSFSAFTLLEA